MDFTRLAEAIAMGLALGTFSPDPAATLAGIISSSQIERERIGFDGDRAVSIGSTDWIADAAGSYRNTAPEQPVPTMTVRGALGDAFSKGSGSAPFNPNARPNDPSPANPPAANQAGGNQQALSTSQKGPFRAAQQPGWQSGALDRPVPRPAVKEPRTMGAPFIQVQVSNPRAAPYFFRVAYLWVPNRLLANGRMVSGSDTSRAAVSGRLPTQPHVLQGFSFHFGNSDHFLRNFGVHLMGRSGLTAFSRVPNGLDQVVSWQDANQDDPIQWTVRFSDLVGPSFRYPSAGTTPRIVQPRPGR